MINNTVTPVTALTGVCNTPALLPPVTALLRLQRLHLLQRLQAVLNAERMDTNE